MRCPQVSKSSSTTPIKWTKDVLRLASPPPPTRDSLPVMVNVQVARKGAKIFDQSLARCEIRTSLERQLTYLIRLATGSKLI